MRPVQLALAFIFRLSGIAFLADQLYRVRWFFRDPLVKRPFNFDDVPSYFTAVGHFLPKNNASLAAAGTNYLLSRMGKSPEAYRQCLLPIGWADNAPPERRRTVSIL